MPRPAKGGSKSLRVAPRRQTTVRRTTTGNRLPVKVAPIRRRAPVRRAQAPRRRAAPPAEESIGASIGKVLGHGAQQLFKMVTGFGDYNVENNTLLDGGMSPPMIVNSIDNGGVIIRHREYIKDINATSAFDLVAYDINPGLSGTFPWLAGVADAYEQYQFRGLIFEFKSLSSDAVLSSSTSSALGSVMMATSYNALDPNFSTKSQMLNYEFANSSKPSDSFVHPIECATKLTPVDQLYVRTGAVPAGGDQRLYDIGNFQVATVGMQASSGICGELWATYEIEFFKPKFGSLGVGDFDLWRIDVASPSFPLGTIPTHRPSTLGGTLAHSNSAYIFPPGITSGFYLCTYAVFGTAVVLDWTVPVISGGTMSSNSQAPFDGVTVGQMNFQFVVTVTGVNCSIQLPTGSITIPGGANTGYFSVVSWGSASLS